MIKIPNWYSKEIIDYYAAEIQKEFKKDFIVFAQDSDGKDISVDTYKILTLTKSELFAQEPNAKLYYEIMLLINCRSKKISECCKEKRISSYRAKRKEWVDILCTNSGNDTFIKQFTTEFPEFYKNEDNFNSFIDKIEIMLKENLAQYMKNSGDT